MRGKCVDLIVGAVSLGGVVKGMRGWWCLWLLLRGFNCPIWRSILGWCCRIDTELDSCSFFAIYIGIIYLDNEGRELRMK